MAESDKDKQVSPGPLQVSRRQVNRSSGGLSPRGGVRHKPPGRLKHAAGWIIGAALAGLLVARILPKKRARRVRRSGDDPQRPIRTSSPAHPDRKRPGLPNLVALVMDLVVAVAFNVVQHKAAAWRVHRLTKRKPPKTQAKPEHPVPMDSRPQKLSASRDQKADPKPEKIRAGTSRVAQALDLCKRTAAEWSQDKCPQLGAALAYYTVFSLAPLVLVLLAVFGLIFGGSEHAREKLTEQLRYMIDPSGIKVIQDIAANASEPKGGLVATAVGLVVGLFGASGVFGQLQDALNTIWGVKPKPGRGIAGFVRTRFLSFSMVGGICFLLLASLTVEGLLRGFNRYLRDLLPGGDILALTLFFAFDLGVVLLLFAMIFRYLPDAKIAWRDVWIGAALTAVLFVIGKFVLALYLGSGAAGSAYGAASSLITLLLWIFYAAQILLFGAEFTQVYANTYGSQVEPQDHAVRVERTEVEVPAEGQS